MFSFTLINRSYLHFILLLTICSIIFSSDIYNNSWAVIVGIDEYTGEGLKELHYAVDDAEDIDFFVANFNVDLYTTLGVAKVEDEATFTYYPNPVNNNLTLSAQKEINNVSVYNMVGQEVFRNVPNAMTEVVDMSSLQAGAYFVKVTIGNATKTVKVIKN